MLDSILQFIPHARVGFIGLKREETTLRALFYHKSFPKNLGRFEVILIDPMLATGGSAVAALDLLVEQGANTSASSTSSPRRKASAACGKVIRACRSSPPQLTGN